jgi:hypothetical protein
LSALIEQLRPQADRSSGEQNPRELDSKPH